MLRAFAVCCLLILVPRSAAAEWHFTPMAGATFLGSTNVVDPELGSDNVHRAFGGAVGLLGGGLFGVETIGVWTPGFLQDERTHALDRVRVESSRVVALMANAVLTAPRRWTEYNLRPFVSGGVGWLHISRTDRPPGIVPGGPLLPLDENLYGFNIGGGAVGFLTARTGIRFDVRYYGNLKPTDEGPVGFGNVRVRYVTASVGIVFRRGFK